MRLAFKPQILPANTRLNQAADCRVFDQLSHSGVPPVLPQMALPLALSTFALLFLEGEVHAQWAALFEARGPPLTR